MKHGFTWDNYMSKVTEPIAIIQQHSDFIKRLLNLIFPRRIPNAEISYLAAKESTKEIKRRL